MKKNSGTRGLWPPFVKTKTGKIMRLTFFFLLLGFMQVAASSYSQTTRLNIDMRDATVREVLQAIENQSKFRFAYSSEFIDLDRKINISIQDQEIEEILKTVFSGTSVKYEIEDRHIMLLVPGKQPANQQQKPVRGTVSDFSGAPLPGVSVVVKGTTNGMITDADGNYSLINVPENATLQFSFVGMKGQEILVTGKDNINVVLEEDAIGIEEVVAIGYGDKKFWLPGKTI